VNVLALLIPASVLLGLVGLAAFLWLLRNDQFEDPEGQAARILSDRYDDVPADDRPHPTHPAPRPSEAARRDA
jgi:cbb3-type cytochrome oxidase maturation protein